MSTNHHYASIMVNKTFVSLILLFGSMLMANAQSTVATVKIANGTSGVPTEQIAAMERNINRMLADFEYAVEKNKGVKLDPEGINPETITRIRTMWKKSTPMSTPAGTYPLTLSRVANSNCYELRGLPIEMLNAETEAEQRQSLTIVCEPSGRIVNVAVGVDFAYYQDLMKDAKNALDEARRQRVLDFVEEFRTAYVLKDINHIKMVFSDEAVIITGVVKPITRSAGNKRLSDGRNLGLSEQQVVYNRMTKTQYIEKLSKQFKGWRYVHCQYSDIEVINSPANPDVYCVRLVQDWRTKGWQAKREYHDEGYLLLLIDFSDDNNPQIMVRTWQPKEATTEEQRFNLGNFNIATKVGR